MTKEFSAIGPHRTVTTHIANCLQLLFHLLSLICALLQTADNQSRISSLEQKLSETSKSFTSLQETKEMNDRMHEQEVNLLVTIQVSEKDISLWFALHLIPQINALQKELEIKSQALEVQNLDLSAIK